MAGDARRRGASRLGRLGRLASLSPPPFVLDRAGALRAALPRIAVAAGAAGVAWLVASDVLGNEQPFFAPIAAVLTLGLAIERRGSRAWELALGVALGIGIADLIVLATGTGAWQLVLVVCLAMAAAVLAGGGVLLVNQAAISAVLVTTLQMPEGSFSGERFVDAVVGCGVALVANALAPVDPVRHVLRQVEPLLARMSGALVDIADALATSDLDAAREALERLALSTRRSASWRRRSAPAARRPGWLPRAAVRAGGSRASPRRPSRSTSRSATPACWRAPPSAPWTSATTSPSWRRTPSATSPPPPAPSTATSPTPPPTRQPSTSPSAPPHEPTPRSSRPATSR
jgi:hypothetical protein